MAPNFSEPKVIVPFEIIIKGGLVEFAARVAKKIVAKIKS